MFQVTEENFQRNSRQIPKVNTLHIYTACHEILHTPTLQGEHLTWLQIITNRLKIKAVQSTICSLQCRWRPQFLMDLFSLWRVTGIYCKTLVSELPEGLGIRHRNALHQTICIYTVIKQELSILVYKSLVYRSLHNLQEQPTIACCYTLINYQTTASQACCYLTHYMHDNSLHHDVASKFQQCSEEEFVVSANIKITCVWKNKAAAISDWWS